MLQKFNTTSLFKKAPIGFFLTETTIFFSASGRIDYFTFIITCPLKYAKKWSLFNGRSTVHLGLGKLKLTFWVILPKVLWVKFNPVSLRISPAGLNFSPLVKIYLARLKYSQCSIFSREMATQCKKKKFSTFNWDWTSKWWWAWLSAILSLVTVLMLPCQTCQSLDPYHQWNLEGPGVRS